MIASENFVPRAVLEAAGSVLTNKYASRLPGPPLLRRAASRSTSSSSWHRQGRWNSSALATRTSSRIRAPRPTTLLCMALLEPGETIMASPSTTVAISHGMKLNVSGKLYNVVRTTCPVRT